MNNMRLPTRRAPTIEDARRTQNEKNEFKKKKTPPPRPPPPNLAKSKSKSAWNLNQNDNTVSLIDWSPPNSPTINNYNSHAQFNGSISSSFSSSASSLASSKRSYEYDNSNDWIQVASSTFYQKPPGYNVTANNGNAPAANATKPTIIRAAPPKKGKVLRPTASASTSREVSPLPPYFHSNTPLIPTPVNNTEKDINNSPSPPMPNIPPPSPPKDVKDVVVPFGIALYDYNTGQSGDLQFMVNDVIYLTSKINDEWFMGKTIDDREGMFPKNYIDIQVPLPNKGMNNSVVKAIFDFVPQVKGDLSFKMGDSIKVLRIIDSNWLEGECNGNIGQFPANFVDRIPANIN